MTEQIYYDVLSHPDDENTITHGSLIGSLLAQTMTHNSSHDDSVNATLPTGIPNNLHLTPGGIFSNYLSFDGADNKVELGAAYRGSESDSLPLMQNSLPCTDQVSQDFSATNHPVDSQNRDHYSFGYFQLGRLFDYGSDLPNNSSFHIHGPSPNQEEQKDLIDIPYGSTHPPYVLESLFGSQDLLKSPSLCVDDGSPMVQDFELSDIGNINFPARSNSFIDDVLVGFE